jgi:hypothetical protein
MDDDTSFYTKKAAVLVCLYAGPKSRDKLPSGGPGEFGRGSMIRVCRAKVTWSDVHAMCICSVRAGVGSVHIAELDTCDEVYCSSVQIRNMWQRDDIEFLRDRYDQLMENSIYGLPIWDDPFPIAVFSFPPLPPPPALRPILEEGEQPT